MKAISMVLTNVTNKEAAQPLVELLQGKTYMNLGVAVCPVRGSYDVVINTFEEEPSDHAAEELEDLSGDKEELKRLAIKNEMQGLVMMIMADQIMKK